MDERQLRHMHTGHIVALKNFESVVLDGEVPIDSEDGQAVLQEFRDAVRFLEGLIETVREVDSALAHPTEAQKDVRNSVSNVVPMQRRP
jgi:hypothetical protein